jgi:hypothetical protein
MAVHVGGVSTAWPWDVVTTVVSGVLVAMILALVRLTWSRSRVPTALSRVVRRKTYLGAVLSESKNDQVVALDVLAPRLAPATDSPRIANIQAAWKQINTRGQVRVLTLDAQECIEGGAELLADGLAVRVARRELGYESLSYHLFDRSPGPNPTAIVNHHLGTTDRPVRLSGVAPTEVLRDHFNRVWQAASPLEAVIAEKVSQLAGGSNEPAAILRALGQARSRLNINSYCVDRLLPHLAFRTTCPVIFVVGLPGAGKSHVRRSLMRQLSATTIKSCELTDYPFAYRDYLHGLIQLEPHRGAGFEPYLGGAFAVKDESALLPALRALAQAIRDSVSDFEVTLAEFARANLISSLGEFDELRFRCRLIYVHAPTPLREERLKRRAEPPESRITGDEVAIRLSDNHLLPLAAERSLYAVDDIDHLMDSPFWRERVYRIENDVDDGGGNIEARLAEFVADVIDRYRPGKRVQAATTGLLARSRM